MDTQPLLDLARKLMGDVTFCVAATRGENGEVHARVVQPRPLQGDWAVDVLTNRRCRKVREIERHGRMTLLYQHDLDHSYVSLSGPALIVEDRALKRATWTDAHYRWNPGGPDDPDTVFARLRAERIELWSAAYGVMPDPEGYSAAVLFRVAEQWRYSTT